MKTYWDLSEAERGMLTSDDVQKYVDAELMLKGVLKVKPLVLEPVPPCPEPDTRLFFVRFAGKYGRTDSQVAFTTIEAAKAFVALRPVSLSSEYLDGTSVTFSKESSDPEIAEVPTFTEDAKNTASAALRRSAAIKAANEKRSDEYAAAVRTQEKALEGLWDDWSTHREAAAKLRAVADTFEDYKRTAGGDEVLAASFLEKVYPSTLIAEAAARFGFLPQAAP